VTNPLIPTTTTFDSLSISTATDALKPTAISPRFYDNVDDLPTKLAPTRFQRGTGVHRKLRNPLHHHSSSNQFIGRYAYLVLPIGKTLDFNYIHNFLKALT
jgi:hypothetical protein